MAKNKSFSLDKLVNAPVPVLDQKNLEQPAPPSVSTHQAVEEMEKPVEVLVAESSQTPAAEPSPTPAAEPLPIPAAEPLPIPAAEPLPIPAAEPLPIPLPSRRS